jgi:serine protease inhibitor ecotin
MKRSHANRLVVAVSAFFLATSQAIACRCVEPVAPKAAYRNASVAVKAQVTDLKTDPAKDATTVTLAVSHRWKQNAAEQIEVVTDTNCAYPFEKNREYVLFLQKDKGMPGYYTARCMGNQPIDKGESMLKWLDKYGKAGAPR